MRWVFYASLSVLVSAACASPDDVSSQSSQPNQQESGGSCVDACGKQSLNGSCWCDATCTSSGDCCSDIGSACGFPSQGTGGAGATGGTAGTGGKPNPGGGGTGAFGGSSFGGASSGGAPGTASCAGHCGSSAPGEICWCDPECVQAGNCCPDFNAYCGGNQPTTGGCTAQLCNSENPALENGVDCYCNVACFDYGDCCSNVEAVCGI